MSNTAPLTGTLTDPDGQAWLSATWFAFAASLDGPPVFSDGSAIPTYSGQLDATGTFTTGVIGRTDMMQPSGTTLTFVICSVTSAPCQTITGVTVIGAAPNLGTLLSPRLAALRIPAASLVYAYSVNEIVNATAGSGYVNTTSNAQYLFVGSGTAGQHIQVTGSKIIQAPDQATAISDSTANPQNIYFWV